VLETIANGFSDPRSFVGAVAANAGAEIISNDAIPKIDSKPRTFRASPELASARWGVVVND
jgi:hypothetical protein